ncbi:MAG: hypothetical protein O3B95_12675 [Chloroflexi bacterium]|nr:hypothetical protein [Chloroflexota bacterium]
MAKITGNLADDMKQSARDMVRLLATGTDLGRGKVYAQLITKFGPEIGEVVKPRTVGYWLSESRKQSKVREFRFEDWVQWKTELKREPRASFLLTLYRCSRVLLQGRAEPNLRVHEAEWAGRLEYDLQSLKDPITQWAIIREYAHREAMAYERTLNYYTYDLDDMLVYKPWTQDDKGRYRKAIDAGIATPPLMLTLVIEPDRADQFDWWLAGRVHANLNLPYHFVEHDSPDHYSDGVFNGVDPFMTTDWRDVLEEYARLSKIQTNHIR